MLKDYWISSRESTWYDQNKIGFSIRIKHSNMSDLSDSLVTNCKLKWKRFVRLTQPNRRKLNVRKWDLKDSKWREEWKRVQAIFCCWPNVEIRFQSLFPFLKRDEPIGCWFSWIRWNSIVEKRRTPSEKWFHQRQCEPIDRTFPMEKCPEKILKKNTTTMSFFRGKNLPMDFSRKAKFFTFPINCWASRSSGTMSLSICSDEKRRSTKVKSF